VQVSRYLVNDPFFAIKAHNPPFQAKLSVVDCSERKYGDTAAPFQNAQVTPFRNQPITGFPVVDSFHYLFPEIWVKIYGSFNGYTTLTYSRDEFIQRQFIPDKVVVFHPVCP